MIIQDLLRHEWKKNFRAQGFYKNLAVNIMLGIFALYMMAIFLFLGFSLNEILEKADNVLNPMELFNRALLYMVLGGLTLRFFLQQLNTFNLPPYQILPVHRSTLVNFLLLKPLFSPVNYFLLLVIVPFAVKSVVGYYSVSVAVRFVLNFIFIIWFNSQMAAFLKRKFGSGLWSFLAVIAVLAIIVALEYFKVFSLFRISGYLFDFIVLKPFGLVIPFLAAFGAYLLNRWFFSANYYPEKFNEKVKGNKATVNDFNFLNRFGVTGEIITMEIKLILRHKRTKSMLYMAGFFLLYGLLFYTQKVYSHNMGMLFFVAMFMTGILMLLFGQWFISWDSHHFDGLMTRNIPIRTYVTANYLLMIAFNILCFVLTTPYFYFGMKIVALHLAAFAYNVGVNTVVLLYMATFNTRKVDLSKSQAMNYQGTTYKSFLIVLPIMFIPMIVVWALTTFFSVAVALWTLAGLGIAGILFRQQLLGLCVSQFNRRKYKLAEGFRESE